MKNRTAIRAANPIESIGQRKDELRDWQALNVVLADYPMIAPLLAKLERIAGETPIHLWLAAALFEFVEMDDEGTRQSALIYMLSHLSAQDCKVKY